MTDIMQDEDLALDERVISLHALNPFLPYSSSPRALMFSGQFSQALVIEEPAKPIIQTGLERQLAKNTFSKKVSGTQRVISIIKRYNGLSVNGVSGECEYAVMMQDTETSKLDVVSIPYYHKLHQHYGYKYNISKGVTDRTILHQVLNDGDILADSPAVTPDGDYGYGRPVNIAYLNIPEVTGDGVVISESLAKKFAFRSYETVVVEFGEKTYPLNLYGDKDNYKIFPEIGDMVREDRVIMGTREYETTLSPALVSAKDLQEYSSNFDKVYYSKKAGGRVVDIRVHYNEKARKSTYTETTTQADRYAAALTQYYKDVLACYEEQARIYRARTRKDLPVTERLHRLLIDAYAMTESSRRVKYSYKNDPVDLYRVEFVIEHITGLHDGVIGGINKKGYKLASTSGYCGYKLTTLNSRY